MHGAFLGFLFLCGLNPLRAATIKVVVGETGCTARQLPVKKSWLKLPGVISVTVLPRQPNDAGGQRAFVIVSGGASPTDEALRTALGRRVKHYPILHLGKPAEAGKRETR